MAQRRKPDVNNSVPGSTDDDAPVAKQSRSESLEADESTKSSTQEPTVEPSTSNGSTAKDASAMQEGNDTPSLRHKRSSTTSEPEAAPLLKRKRSSTEDESSSIPKEAEALKKPAITKANTFILKEATTGEGSQSMDPEARRLLYSSITLLTTAPSQVEKVASLTRTLTKASPTMLKQVRTMLTEPTTSDPEVRELIAKSQELMHRACTQEPDPATGEGPSHSPSVSEHSTSSPRSPESADFSAVPSTSDAEAKLLTNTLVKLGRQSSLIQGSGSASTSRKPLLSPRSSVLRKQPSLKKVPAVISSSESEEENDEASNEAPNTSTTPAKPALSEAASLKEDTTGQSAEQEKKPEDAVDETAPPASRDTSEKTTDDKFDEDHRILCEVHPECDPVYLKEQLQVHAEDPERVSTVTFAIYENPDVPTRAAREEIEANLKRQEELKNMALDMDTFLSMYPDPEEEFDHINRDLAGTPLYAEYAAIFLKNCFPIITASHISAVLRRCAGYMSAAHKELTKQHQTYLNAISQGRKVQGKQKRFLKTPRTTLYDYPNEVDEYFFWERLYINNREEILKQISAKRAAHDARMQAAREAGELVDCDVCCLPDLLPEATRACLEGHHFCKDCVRQSAEEQIGQGRSHIACLDSNCPSAFTLFSLEELLEEQSFKQLVKRVQTEEVEQANIEGLAICPFCPYAVVVPQEYYSSVLICENPDCMQDSCMKCKTSAHTPLSCDEAKGLRKNRMKEFAENALADAMIRQCPKCNLRFFKEEGCNHMTCSKCGTNMCYVCRKVIPGYQHFRESPNCRPYVNPNLLHQAEVMRAYDQLAERFREENPTLGQVDAPAEYRPEVPTTD